MVYPLTTLMCAGSLFSSTDGRAEPAPTADQTALFALVIGANRSVDSQLEPLRFADDDAARYFNLFRTLGARTYVLMRSDDNTRRVYPQAAAEALEPREAAVAQVVQRLAQDVRRAQARHIKTLLYFVYAGHGNIDGGGYLSLEDLRLDSKALFSTIIDPIGSDEVHLIVDACYSYFLAYGRGPGGTRRAAQGFSRSIAIERDNVGLLLSTSEATESHEWEAYHAGVFSHEIRSGLYGAADANGDGLVSYKEIAAFVARANSAIPNERFRPRVFARPPTTSDILVDLRQSMETNVEVDGSHSGHYFLEDSRGVRLLDFNNGRQQATRVLRPHGRGPLYLRRADDAVEYVIPDSAGPVRIAELTPRVPTVRERGAAHAAFEQLFSLPFDEGVVSMFQLSSEPAATEPPRPWTRIAAWPVLGTSLLTLVAGGTVTAVAAVTLYGIVPEDSQQSVAEKNRHIHNENVAAIVLFSIAGASAATGLGLLLWPADDAD